MNRKIIVAIDGYSSCGKSTLAKALAAKLNYAYIDSGAMYRAVTLYFLRNRISLDDDKAIKEALRNIEIHFEFDAVQQLQHTFLNHENVETEIRGVLISNNVSEVSAIKEVRKAMVNLQRKAGKNKGIVMDGRDIGSNVFPDAELKIFMTADPDVRAQRRYLELMEKGQDVSIEEIKENLAHRDLLDTTRKENPLVQPKDSLVLDNSHMNREEQLEWIFDHAKRLKKMLNEK
jgi:cytidylate kinase